MEKFRLRSHNGRITAGWGDRVVDVTNRGHTEDPDRWDRVRVFRIKDGSFVLGVCHYSNYIGVDGEDGGDFYITHRCKTQRKLLAWVRLECPSLLSDTTSQLETIQVAQHGESSPKTKERTKAQ